MSSYTKTTWSDYIGEDVNAANLNKIETGIYDAHVEIGDLTSLTTTVKTSLVLAINELDAEIGDLTSLTTTEKSTLVGAINELDSYIDDLFSDVGNLGSLTTTAVSDLVSAINELDAENGDLSTLTTTATTLASAINELDLEKVQIISSNTTIYLSATGNDSTGDGSSGSPWYSLNKAFDYLKNKYINSDVYVTISLADGSYTGTSLDIYYVFSSRVKVIGTSSTSTVITYTDQSGITIYSNLSLIQDLKVNGNDASYNGIQVINANVVLNNVISRDFNNGLRIDDFSYVEVYSCVFQSNVNGGKLVNNAHIKISASDFINNTSTGLDVSNSSTAEFAADSSDVTGNTTYGLRANIDSFINEILNTGSVSSNGTNYSPAASTSDDPTFGNKGSWIYG